MEDIKHVIRSSETSAKRTAVTPAVLDDAAKQAPHSEPSKRHFSHSRGTRSGFPKLPTVILGIFCIGLAAYLYIAWRQSIPAPLPSDAVSSLNFQVFYPSYMPSGFRYKKDSATSHYGLLFYKFTSGKKVITVTEQAVPPKSLDVLKISGDYTALKISIGKAGIGTSVGRPSVIIITDSTLINITSNQGVTKDQVIAVAQKMKPFNLQPAP